MDKPNFILSDIEKFKRLKAGSQRAIIKEYCTKFGCEMPKQKDFESFLLEQNSNANSAINQAPILAERERQSFINSLDYIPSWRKKKKVRRQKPQKITILKSSYLLEVAKLKDRPYREFLSSRYWSIVRISVFKRDNYKCTVCGNRENLQVHHTTYKNHFNEHKNLQDLITICDTCHLEYHKTVEMPK